MRTGPDCYYHGNSRVTHVKNRAISLEWGHNRIVITMATVVLLMLKTGDKSWMRTGPDCYYHGNSCVTHVKNPAISLEWGPDCYYHKQNIFVVISNRYSVMVNQAIMATVKLSKWWVQLSHYGPLVQWLPCKQRPTFTESMIGTTNFGISDQLRGIYSVCLYCWNVTVADSGYLL